MKKRLRIIIIIVGAFLILVVGGFSLYVSDYYKTEDIFLNTITQNYIYKNEKNMIIMTPASPSDTAFIFYPGGKVEYTAYIPILEKLRQNGVACVLVKMPFNLAVFKINAADTVYDKFPDVKNWYIGGHSLGGAMASSYVEKNSTKVKGLILFGAYPVNDINIPTLCIYGSEDKVLDKTKLEGVLNTIEIVGGNHAYFGNYGEQKGDGIATITREEQQEQAVSAILKFLK